ncbi:TPA: exosome complex protein Rrp42 [Candidatus Woesearchaeota archaeon]|nr:Ribosomal RNA-processing protein RRP42 [archaeon GW2011_AR15]MBS3104224.1 exosome complex protein Rrp42 [Candidatus Woesearchaeota archaeon]HIH41945.1 exosome complex protein Rrp42 [Candidatus Woesearchaeota archaeon]
MNKEKQDHVLNYLNKNVRYDGRKKDEYRKITVETGIAATAEGSAKVTIGETVVLAGVKFEVGAPYPDQLDKGTMMVNAELLPMSNPRFESGPPNIESIELARVVDRGIRESNAIDYKKLCIKEGELVWTVIVDITPLNADGNLFDASALAVLLAIKDAKMPKLKDNKIDYKSKTDQKVPMLEEPISVTVLKIGNHYIVDPVSDEEDVLDARLTVALTKDNTICALQKGGEQPLSEKEIEEMVDLAVRKSKELRGYLR